MTTAAPSQTPSKDKRESKSLREAEYEVARADIAKTFGAVAAFCDKVDKAAEELGAVVAGVATLERRMSRSWTMRELRLDRRLLLPRFLREVGTAVVRLKAMSKTVRAVSDVIRQEVEEELSHPESFQR